MGTPAKALVTPAAETPVLAAVVGPAIPAPGPVTPATAVEVPPVVRGRGERGSLLPLGPGRVKCGDETGWIGVGVKHPRRAARPYVLRRPPFTRPAQLRGRS